MSRERQIEIERVRPLIQRWLDDTQHTAQDLSRKCGLSDDHVSKILHGYGSTRVKDGKRVTYDRKYVTFSVLDAILSKGLQNPYLWWTHFKDIYERPIPPNEFDMEVMEEKNVLFCFGCEELKDEEKFRIAKSVNAKRTRSHRCRECERDERKRASSVQSSAA